MKKHEKIKTKKITGGLIINKQIIPNEKKGLAKWTMRDLLVTASLSLVFAILLLGATYLFTMFMMFLGPLVIAAAGGIWLIPTIFIAYILRRPGAALLAQSMISLVTAPLSPWGWMELMFIPLIAGPVELTFLATRYRNYHLPVLMTAGIAQGVVRAMSLWVFLGINILSIEIQIGFVIFGIVSNAAAGWLAKVLADTVAKTGVLSSYVVGQEIQEEV